MEYLIPGYMYKALSILNNIGDGANHFTLHKMEAMTARAITSLPNNTQTLQGLKGPTEW